ncbi:MAG TPA: type II toxin-antitoxin system RelE/ParE family toxin [Acetobacteraceae bacterium]|nr:type II toxin-antitoxin system RelE/ParE family toxin [Acetobacteraceae bacterium]
MSLEFFAPQAARELERAVAQIAESNPAAAEAFLRTALAAATRIASRPGLGSVRPHLPSRYRFWPLTRYSYLLVYDATTDPALILRVVHMRRDLPKLLSDVPPQR